MSSDHQGGASHGLLEYTTTQQIFQVGNTRIGGRPGAQPTVLIGTIFYHRHDVVRNAERGEIDTAEAERRIRIQEDFSARTGNPCMLDVVGSSPEAIVRNLEFAAKTTDMPLLIDGTTADVRIAGLKYVAQAGLADRVVYNSIQPEITDDEFTAIQDAGVTAAILLTYYLLDFTAKGRVQAVRELLPRAHQAGVTKLIVDTCVLDLATLGQACSAMHDIKNEFGLPVGGGVHNAVAVWKGLKTKMGEQAVKPCVAAVCASSVAMGADFILYGPIEDAPYVFPAVAMIDTALSQLLMERGERPDENHPRFRVG
ncbi:MAG: tetrahydromethanopterin S-methyltransferase subunit H [Pirellulaceae bacterium]|jgi:tetrahydromethanopterin S-methyltransferase subunit H|nr:tetrahydromethanopterin S-methyltransferase subunit H [Pirellulaceae bacterium]